MTFADFLDNELVQSGVLHELQIIGQAARMVSAETKAIQPTIDWSQMTGMRNRLAHEYFAVRLDVVWQTVQVDIPPLIIQLEQHVPPEQDRGAKPDNP
jgi:uncharacterized protein with HEPN domain